MNSIGNIDPYASKSKSYFAMFTIVHSIEETLKDFYDYKVELKSKYRNDKYLPKLEFNGREECFDIKIINNII